MRAGLGPSCASAASRVGALDTFSFLVRETKNMPPQPTEIAALLMQDVIELSEARMAYVARIKQAVDNLQLALGM